MGACCVTNSNKQKAITKIQQRGEQTIIKFESGHYAGGKFGMVKNDGIICLTNKHIYFVGACCCQTKLEIPVNTIKGVEQSKGYHGRYRLQPDGDDCGFYVRNIQEWKKMLEMKNDQM